MKGITCISGGGRQTVAKQAVKEPRLPTLEKIARCSADRRH